MTLPEIFPKPVKAAFGKTACDFSRAQWLYCPARASDILKRHVRDFRADLQEHFAGELTVTSGMPASGGVFLSLAFDRDEKCLEAFAISIKPGGIVLAAGGEAGLFYGLGVLRQLFDQCGARLPSGTISDRPDFPNRGMMLDVSRCKVPTMPSLFKYIDLLARFRINELQLYIEHTFAFSAHQTVWHDASPFTAEEIQAVDAYCRERFIRLVPNLNSFGHFERWLRHPEYKRLAECPDGFEYPWGGGAKHGSTLKPDRESLAFLDALYAEYLPNFGSRLFNIGCDETWELGKGWSKAKCEKLGVTRVYVDFLLQLYKLAKKHDRTPTFWGDIILHEPKLIPELPKDLVANVWGYEAAHPFDKQCPEFEKAGIPFYVCPGTSSWGALVGRTSNALANLENAARNGRKHGAMGFLITDWGDGGHHQYLPVSYIGLAAGAAMSWNHAANRGADVPRALDRLVFQDSAGILGTLFAEMGRVQDLGEFQTSNSSVFQHMFAFDMVTRHDWLDKIPPATLEKYPARFSRLEAMLPAARPRAADGALVKAEASNAIAMALHGIHRLQAFRNKRIDRGALRHELQGIIMRHEDLWLARNRRGGLRESSGNIRERLAALA